MTNRVVFSLFAAIAVSAMPALSQQRNVILFVGDGAGISSLNAASILGYGKPQALYIHRMSHLALADTSTEKEWVTDAAACASAWATGHKGRNGVVSMSADAERDVRDGEAYKTVMEYAMEQGFATGVISNDGVAGAAVAAFYAHHNNRGKAGEIFEQALNPRFGKGPDLIIGSGRRQIGDQTAAMGRDLAADIRDKGYTLVDSMQNLEKLDKSKDRVIALFDETDFDFTEAVRQAVARLSRNPRGYLLIAHSDCHTGKTRTSLSRLVALDKAVAATAETAKDNTLILFTADHSYDLRIKGENLTETSKASDHRNIGAAVSLEDEHTAEEVPVLAEGPGSERIHGFIPNTEIFHVMMSRLGFEK